MRRSTPHLLSVSRLLAVALLPVSVAIADPPAPPPPPPAPPSPAAGIPDNLQLGARYFDEAIQWVARGGVLGKTRDFYAHLDATWDLPDKHEEGVEEVWFAAPDRMRNTRTYAAHTTTKILSGEQAWAILPTGSVVRIHGTPDAAKTLAQMREDMVRVQDLTAFVTLEGLKGPGVVFEFVQTTQGSAGSIYEGQWLKVNRRSPDGRKMTFWIAYDADAEGKPLHATWPGVVRVDGDAAQHLPTEDWILSEWDHPSSPSRPFRYPRKVQGWRINPDKEAAKTDPPKRFLYAVIDDVRINQGMSDTLFQPPPAPPAPDAKPPSDGK